MRKRNCILALLAVAGICLAASEKKAAVSAEPGKALQAAMLVEEAFANVVDACKPSIVIITNKQSTLISRAMDQVPQDFFDFFNFPGFPNMRQRRQQPEQQSKGPVRPAGRGSGFFITDKGHVVTNYHVIKDSEFLEVKTADGTVYDNQKDPDAVKIIGYDKESDLAILQIAGGKKAFPALTFADSDKLRVGQWAIAIGAPFNLDYSVTIGCVSQKGRTDMGVSTFDSYIQTDASINPGNSGGPLLNIRGEVIGVNQFIVTGGGASRGSVGVGFAIASNFAKQITGDLIENGQISRPFLGVSMQDLTTALKAELELEKGVLVREVIPGLAAEKAGVKAGDVIVSLAGVQIGSSHELLMEVSKHKPGVSLDLGIVRNGKPMVIRITPGRRDEYMARTDGDFRREPQNKAERSFSRLGLKLNEQDGRVVVAEVIAGGAAERAGEGNEDRILPGDVILDINRMPVKSIADVKQALGELRKNTVIAYVERPLQNNTSYKFFIAIDLGK